VKRKKPKYRKKRFNLDTLEINAILTSNALGVHAPIQTGLLKSEKESGLNSQTKKDE